MTGLNITWAGLGTMGLPMALRAIECGHRVTPYASPQRRGQTGAEAVSAAQPGKRPARHNDLLALCVPSHVETAEIIDAFGDALPRVVLDMSTIAPAAARAFHRDLLQRGVHYIDAPISGSKHQARAGTLTLFVGATRGMAPHADRLIEHLSGTACYLNSPGKGAAAKLVNQVMHLTNMLGLRLGHATAREQGLDFEALAPVLQTASAKSAMLDRFGTEISQYDTDPHFKLALACKDLRLVADTMGQPHDAFFDAVAQTYEAVRHQLGGEVNFSAVASAIAQGRKKQELADV